METRSWQPSPAIARLLTPRTIPVYGEHGFDVRETWEPPADLAPAVIDDARRALAELAARLEAPCPRDYARTCLVWLSNTKAQQAAMTADDAEARLRAMSAILERFPAEAVGEGCRACAERGGTFFPALAELIRFIEPVADRMRRDHERLRRLLEARPLAITEEAREASAEVRALVQAKVRVLTGKATLEDHALIADCLKRHGVPAEGAAT